MNSEKLNDSQAEELFIDQMARLLLEICNIKNSVNKKDRQELLEQFCESLTLSIKKQSHD